MNANVLSEIREWNCFPPKGRGYSVKALPSEGGTALGGKGPSQPKGTGSPPTTCEDGTGGASSGSNISSESAHKAAGKAPPPPAGGKGARQGVPTTNWKTQRAEAEAKRAASHLFRDGSIYFGSDAWDSSHQHYCEFLPSSDGRSSGAIRITIPHLSTTVVVKGSPTTAQDWAAHLLMKEVLGPHAVPTARLLEYAAPSQEWHAVKDALLRKLPTSRGAMDRPVLTLMGWVDGSPIDSLGGGIFTPSLLRQLGGLCLVDVCIGNFDRLPVGDVFENEGNCTNVLLDRTGHIVAIDTAISVPTSTTYAEKVKTWLSLPREEKWANTLRCLSNLTGTQVPSWASDQLDRGCSAALPALAARLCGARLDEFFTELVSIVAVDWGDVWINGVKNCRPEVLAAIGDVLASYTEVNARGQTYVGPLVLTLESADDDALVKLLEDCEPKPDLVVLPELWEPQIRGRSNKEAFLIGLCQKHGCYILGGTYNDGGRCVAALIDPSGRACIRYAKRTLAKVVGTEPGIVSTGLGRVAILICHDGEIASWVDEARDAGAWLVLNPCFVPGVKDTIDLLQKRLAGEAVTRTLCFVRTDIPKGTAMMVTPGYTFYGAGLCRLETHRSDWVGVPPPTRARSTPEANTGNRYFVHRTDNNTGTNPIPDAPLKFHAIEGLELKGVFLSFEQQNVPAALEDIIAGTVKF